MMELSRYQAAEILYRDALAAYSNAESALAVARAKLNAAERARGDAFSAMLERILSTPDTARKREGSE